MRDGAVLATVAFVEEFQRLLPHRCYAPYGPATKIGLIALDDHMDDPLFWLALRVRDPGRWRSLTRLSAVDDRTVRVFLPYQLEEIVREARTFTMDTFNRDGYFTRFFFVEETAAEAARVVRRVSRLPQLDPLDALAEWRIV
jgi:hypothetical protein